MKGLVDIGANLTHRSFRADLAEVLHRAAGEGVATMVVTGLSAEVSRQAVALARSRPSTLACTVGVHPHNAKTFDGALIPTLADLARSERVVAIGECGLDFNRNFSPPAIQRRCFEAQLELAAELGVPVFLHERDAHDAFLEILARWRPVLVGGVVHCFTGGRRELAAYLDLDLHIGVTGWVADERRGAHLREAVPKIPIERLMIETDSPFLLPASVRPRPSKRRNEPAHLPHVLRTVASLRAESVDELAKSTGQTARRFFRLPTCSPGGWMSP